MNSGPEKHECPYEGVGRVEPDGGRIPCGEMGTRCDCCKAELAAVRLEAIEDLLSSISVALENIERRLSGRPR